MTPRRRLRKAEQQLVDAAARDSIERMRALMIELEGEIIERLLPAVPAELRSEAVRSFMNQLGRDLFTAADIAIAIAQEQS